MSQKNLPPEIVAAIVDQINEAIDIPFLNEEQERYLFTLVLSIIISVFIDKTQKS